MFAIEKEADKFKLLSIAGGNVWIYLLISNMKANEDQLKSVNAEKCACRIYGNSTSKTLPVLQVLWD